MDELTDQDLKNLKKMDKRLRPVGSTYDNPALFKRKKDTKVTNVNLEDRILINVESETADYISSYREVHGKSPKASEIQVFQRSLGKPKKTKLKPKVKSRIIETKKVGNVHIPKDRALVPVKKSYSIIPRQTRAVVDISKPNWISHKPKKESFWSRFRRKSKAEGKVASHIAWRSTGNVFGTAKAGARRASGAAAELGYSLPGPVQVFTLAWQKATRTMKWLVILVFLLAIFFVPWGIFYYAGWAMAAAVMFLISLIYWIFVNLFNGIASVVVAVINGIVRVIMGAIIMVVEVILDLLMSGDNSGPFHKVPNPAWAAHYTGDFYANSYYRLDINGSLGYALYVPSHYWWDGHMIMEGALISYNQIANVPDLMVVTAPSWQSWMYETLIVKMFQYIPGLQGLAEGFMSLNEGIAGGFAEFVNAAPGWQVVIVGLIPVIIIICIVLFVYSRNRQYLHG